MLVPRSPILRLAGAVGISLLLLTLGYVGLGLAVRAQPYWLLRFLGESRFFRLYGSYGRVAAALSPGDRDGDGVCDGAEFFCQTDPLKPSSHPHLYLDKDADGIIAELCGILSDDGDAVEMGVYRGTFLVTVGERVRARYWVYHRLQLPSMPPGFRVRLKPPPWLLIGPPGGNLAPEPLILPLTEDGLLLFDAQAQPPQDDPESPLHGEIPVDNAATGERINPFRVHGVWKLQTFVPIVKPVPPDRWRKEPDDRIEAVRIPIDQWPKPTGPRSNLVYMLIEAARDEPNAPWYQITFSYSLRNHSPVIRRTMNGPRKPYTGPIKYRVSTIRGGPQH